MNVKNRTLFTGDNFEILRGFDSDCVDLIYLDPPFNSNRNYSAPIGSKAAGAAFKDTWTLDDVDKAQIGLLAEKNQPLSSYIAAIEKVAGPSMQSYLVMMGVRLLEMKRVLKPTGSIYLHCDDTASHYLKGLMDAIFGRTKFQNEITWKRHDAHNSAKGFGHVTDRILVYGAVPNSDKVRIPLDPDNVRKNYRYEDARGKHSVTMLTGAGASGGESGSPYGGFSPASRNQHWSAPMSGPYADWIDAEVVPGYKAEKSVHKRLALLDAHGMIYRTKNGYPKLKRYLEANPGQKPCDVWTDIEKVGTNATERTGYPTQKPLALLNRIIEASSNPGDVVLDPFCGTATTLVAAENLSRKWIGIDLSDLAVTLADQRIKKARGPLYKVIPRTDIPRRSDIGKPRPYRTNKRTLFGEQKGRCAICNRDHVYENFEVDHRVPRSKGGGDHIENLQLLCGHCNRVKGNREQAWAVARLRDEGFIQ